MLLEFTKLYNQNPLENILIFTLYQNYTLALKDEPNQLWDFEDNSEEFTW